MMTRTSTITVKFFSNITFKTIRSEITKIKNTTTVLQGDIFGP